MEFENEKLSGNEKVLMHFLLEQSQFFSAIEVTQGLALFAVKMKSKCCVHIVCHFSDVFCAHEFFESNTVHSALQWQTRKDVMRDLSS